LTAHSTLADPSVLQRRSILSALEVVLGDLQCDLCIGDWDLSRLRFIGGSFFARALSSTSATITLPLLARIGRQLTIGESLTVFTAPQLQHVDASVFINGPQSLSGAVDNLQRVRGDMQVTLSVASELTFPTRAAMFTQLNTVDGSLVLNGDQTMSGLEFPALRVVGGAFGITSAPELVSLEVPQLAVIGSTVTLRSVDMLTLCRSTAARLAMATVITGDDSFNSTFAGVPVVQQC
jgi:hypothetical protein